jgi:hypothetical protein
VLNNEFIAQVRNHPNDQPNRKVRKHKTEAINKDSITNDQLMTKVTVIYAAPTSCTLLYFHLLQYPYN